MRIIQLCYNNNEVIKMPLVREKVKSLIDHLNDEQVNALCVILQSLVLPLEEITQEEAIEIAEARAEIEAGKGIKAEDVWRELGI